MTKNSVFKRIVAMVLCITMVFGSVPVTFAAETDGGYDQVADSSTVHEWKDFFGPEFNNGSLSTENAGLVWTDKSVYTNEDAPNFGSVSIGENNFLVALSAMASNKEIKGYSAIPTDTVFILDLSQSMDNSGYIPSMVTAANDAIDTLLKLNKHNRISVILYSGNAQNGDSNLNHATTVLPLGRYTAEGKNYIEYTGTLHDTKVKTGNTVRKENGTKITSVEKTTRGGTYIQSGLYLAYKQFESVKNDTVIDNSLIQGGTKRMPIITLMSDGSPTVATTSYTNIETSNHGDGGTNTNTITFLTQLTAAYLKQNVENWYQNDAKFYSLWLKGANDITANGSLQPSASNETLDRWWKTFLSASSGRNVEFSEGSGKDKVTFSVTRDNIIPQVTSTNYSGYGKNYEEAWLSVQNYVDAIFNANNSEGLIDAFDDIVNEIILQSKYYPTLVEGGNYNVDGYITIEDPVGELMEVKQIEGIMLAVENRDVLFTGAALTKYMKEKQFGSSSEYSENGWELIKAIQERLGVNESEAIALATKAWNHGQLSYTSNTEYSNYIGWYCDDNRNYLGFWHEGHTESDRPQNATKIVKSYGFFGEVENKENNLYGAQMLHVVVHVATDIDDGDQLIHFAVPASLIPVMTYSVEVNSNSLSSATSANVSLGGATGPIRLLAEVGLRDDINEVTVAEAIEGHHHTDENGNYVFYTNRWGKDDDFEPSSSSILEKAKVAATSHYKPSVQNDRYYYTENAVIYTDAEGKNKYTGSSKPEDGTFYHVNYNFSKTGINKKVEAIKAESLEAATKNSDETWYIPIGTPYRQILTTYTLNKTENKTGTLGYVDDMLIYKNESNNSYEAYIFNGNNGKMTLAPAQGIELTKTVPVVEAGSRTDNFVFNVKFTSGTDMSGIRVLKEDGKTQKTATVSGNTVKVTLAKDETVYIIGIPTGARYTVTEEDHPIYELDSSSTGLSGTVSEKTINKVSAVNKIKVPGHLVISKTVTHPFGADYVIPAGKKFEVAVTFTVPEGNNLEGVTVSGTENAELDGNVLEFNVEHGQIVSIANLPDRTTYTITETEIQNDGFTLDATASSGLFGTIESNKTSSAALVNNYVPAPVSGEEITVTGTKNLVGREWKAEDSFTFTLSQWDGRNFVVKEVEAGSTENVATSANHDFSLNTAMDEVTFDKAGTYYFWVTEAAATIPGITYDSTYRLFTVTVSDENMDGKLEIKEVKGGDNRVRVTKGTRTENTATIKTWNVDVDFTNVYAPDGSAEAEVFIQKEIEKAAGVTASLEGFQFQVYRVEGEEEIPVGSPYTTDQGGFAEIKLVYGPDSLTKTEADGNVSYDPTTYTYHIKEVIPDEANKIDGMTYTTDYAELKVTLSDNTVGGIDAEVVLTPVNAKENKKTVETSGIVIGKDETGADIIRNGLVFTNTYDLDPKEVVLRGEKTLVGREFASENEFTFELYSTDGTFTVSGNPLQRVSNIAIDSVNKNHGKFVFQPLYFGDKNVGNEYYFVVKEENSGKTINGITYSTAEYHVTVKVTQGTENNILTEVSVVDGTGTAAENNILSFNNKYSVFGEAEATIEGKKELTGRNIIDGEFTFEIIDDEGNITEVSNSGDSFSHTFTYVAPGEYFYIVREKAGSLGGITYDNAEYHVVVAVSDDGKGGLEAEVQYEEEVIFKNLYIPEAAEVTVKGKKVLEGMDLVDGQFKFELYPANENYTVSEGTAPIATATNAGGEFGFNFVFDKAGDYYYVIYEDDSNPIKNVDYDESEYQVHIVVYDDGKGELQHIVKINEAENGEIVFVNKYEKPKEPPKPEKVTKLTVEKVWDDKNDKFGDRPDSVTVVLYANGEKFGRAVLNEENDCSHTFKDLPKNDENGRRIEYTVVEENVPKNYFASYDTTWLGKVIITNTYTEEHNPSTGAPGI